MLQPGVRQGWKRERQGTTISHLPTQGGGKRRRAGCNRGRDAKFAIEYLWATGPDPTCRVEVLGEDEWLKGPGCLGALVAAGWVPWGWQLHGWLRLQVWLLLFVGLLGRTVRACRVPTPPPNFPKERQG